MGSSFPLEKATTALPKFQIDDDSELIDEHSLMTEEDLKKPQLPLGLRMQNRSVTRSQLVVIVGWVMLFDAVLACTEASHHSSWARRFPCLTTSFRLTYD